MDGIPTEILEQMKSYEAMWQKKFLELTQDMASPLRNTLEDHVGLLVHKWVSVLLHGVVADRPGQAEQQLPSPTIESVKDSS